MQVEKNALHTIQRTYRVRPENELQDFWATLKTNRVHDQYLSFRYYKIRLWTLEQVAEYNFKDLRFWFNHRGEHFLVQYYIPLANTLAISNTVLVAGYDSRKRFLGVFLVNQRIDPIFLTANLSELLSVEEPTRSKKEFIEEEISEGIRMEFDLDQYSEIGDDDDYYREASKEEKATFFNQKMEELLQFLPLVYNTFLPDFKMEVKSLKKSFKVSFVAHKNEGPKHKIVKPEIEVPKYDPSLDFYQTVLPLLNQVNFQLWSESPDRSKQYGFYRLEKGIAMLHTQQVCEYLRLGMIPHYSNAQFPSIVFSTTPSGYVNALEYEVKYFATQEEYSAYYKEYMSDRRTLSVRSLEEKDFSFIVNYFLDKPDLQLITDGFLIAKIPFEEELIAQLQSVIFTPAAERKQDILILEEGGKPYGHCQINGLRKKQEPLFSFYDWKGMLRREKVLDGLLNKAIEKLMNQHELPAISAAPTKDDDYRNNALLRLGFVLEGERKFVRDDWGVEQKFQFWRFEK